MPKQTIEVEVPEGWELVGEAAPIIRDHSYPECGSDLLLCHVRIRPVWQYPEWLGGAGVAMDSDGCWGVYENPMRVGVGHMTGAGWYDTKTHDRGGWVRLSGPNGNSPAFPLWQPPECDDWRESWHPNPRWEG